MYMYVYFYKIHLSILNTERSVNFLRFIFYYWFMNCFLYICIGKYVCM